MSGLPGSWATAPLRDLVDLNPKNRAADDADAAFMPMLHLGTDYRHRPSFEVRPWGEIAKSYVHFADGDVLLAKITPCFENGKAGIPQGLPNGIGAGSSEYFVCRPRAQALRPDWLLAHFKTSEFLRNGAQQMTGSVGHKRVPKDFLLGCEIPLPPLAEQQRIADKLDAILARVDACRERLDIVGPLLQRFRQSVLAGALSGELSENAIGSEVWTAVRVGELGRVVTGSTPERVPAGDPSGITALFKPSDLNQGIDVCGSDERLTAAGTAQARLLPARAVLVTCIGATIGKTGLAGVPCATNQQINAVVCDAARVLPAFLYYWFISPMGQHAVIGNASATTLPILNKSKFSALVVQVPSLATQQRIVEKVGHLLAMAERLESRLVELRKALVRTTPALLAKAFRGELVPQDPADEPADQLLARLRSAGG